MILNNYTEVMWERFQCETSLEYSIMVFQLVDSKNTILSGPVISRQAYTFTQKNNPRGVGNVLCEVSTGKTPHAGGSRDILSLVAVLHSKLN
jgi:hypothetical protein